MNKNYINNFFTTAALLSAFLLSGCSSQEYSTSESLTETPPSPDTSYLETTESEPDAPKERKTGTKSDITIDSECIAKNIIGDSSERQIHIYLPPTYDEGEKNYPVIYYLDGLDDNSAVFLTRVAPFLDSSFNSGSKEFIFVTLDGNNSTNGSFYVNSPSSGNWEDFIAEEVVNYMDTNYRTIANRDSRCISGFSMGGFGAINAALNRSDVFGSLIVFCPGIYEDGNIKGMWDSWNGWQRVKLSYGQAFSPTTDSDKNFGNIPEFSGTDEDNAIIEQWDNGYGNWEAKIKEFAQNGTPLNAISINYATYDSFSWINPGCRFFSEKLTENGFENELSEFSGGHSTPFNVVADYYIPFSEKALEFED